MMTTKRKRFLVLGVAGAFCAAIVGGAIVKSASTEMTKSGFMVAGKVDAKISAGTLQMNLSRISPDSISEKNFSEDGSTYRVGSDELDLTYIGTTYQYNKLNASDQFENISPGWTKSIAYVTDNIGSLTANVGDFLGAMHIVSNDTPETWDEQNPLEKIKFTVYAGKGSYTKDTDGNITARTYPEVLNKIAEGKLSEYLNYSAPEAVKTTVTGEDGSSTKQPAPTIEVAVNESAYYIVKLEFISSNDAWNGNETGDNVYFNSQFSVVSAFGATAPTDKTFEFETDAYKNPSGAAVEVTP